MNKYLESVAKEGPLHVEQTQIVAEELQDHTKPYLLLKDEEDKQPKSPLPPNRAFHEEYN